MIVLLTYGSKTKTGGYETLQIMRQDRGKNRHIVLLHIQLLTQQYLMTSLMCWWFVNDWFLSVIKNSDFLIISIPYSLFSPIRKYSLYIPHKWYSKLWPSDWSQRMLHTKLPEKSTIHQKWMEVVHLANELLNIMMWAMWPTTTQMLHKAEMLRCNSIPLSIDPWTSI